MIDLVINLPEYTWKVRFHAAVTCYHADLIIAELRELDCPVDALKEASDLMHSCRKNTGLTYSNGEFRESVVVVSTTTSAAEFQNTLQHEIRHLVDDIVSLNHYYDKEDIAYLTGELNLIIYPYVHRLLCDRCRKLSEN